MGPEARSLQNRHRMAVLASTLILALDPGGEETPGEPTLPTELFVASGPQVGGHWSWQQ